MIEPGRDPKPVSRFAVDPERQADEQASILRGIALAVGKRGWKMEITVNSAMAVIDVHRFEGGKRVTGARLLGATMADALQSARQSAALGNILHENRSHQKADRGPVATKLADRGRVE